MVRYNEINCVKRSEVDRNRMSKSKEMITRWTIEEDSAQNRCDKEELEKKE